MGGGGGGSISGMGGTGTGGGGGVELEVNWDPTMVRGELLQASAILSHRGLKLASKWAAEQVLGIPVGHETAFGTGNGIVGGGTTTSTTTTTANQHHQHQPHYLDNNNDNDDDPIDEMNDSIVSGAIIPLATMMNEMSIMREKDWYTKSLVDLGEYLHAASILSQDFNSQSHQQSQQHNYGGRTNSNSGGGGPSMGGKMGLSFIPQQDIIPNTNTKAGTTTTTTTTTTTYDITQMGPPHSDLSSYGFYIRAYALYMAGERRKEEEFVEMERYGERTHLTIHTGTMTQ
jgi:hypothetical protein